MQGLSLPRRTASAGRAHFRKGWGVGGKKVRVVVRGRHPSAAVRLQPRSAAGWDQLGGWEGRRRIKKMWADGERASREPEGRLMG